MKQELISVELIDPNPYQHKEFVDAAKVAEIAESLQQNLDAGIGTNGLLQVPTARKVDGRYQLAFGHHRHQAFDLLTRQGMQDFYKMPLIIEDLTDQQMFEALAGENLQRRDISFIEEAEVYHTYMITFGKTSVEAAARFGKTEELVRSRLMMLQLPEPAKEAAKKGELNISVARDLVTVNKLLGAEGVEEALEEIKEVSTRFGVFESPREAIDSILGNSKKLMHLDTRAGWFSAKKFPIQYLDKITDNAVTKVMGITLKGATPQLRADLKKLMDCVSAGKDFADGDFPGFARDELQKVHVLVNPPACESCPLHATFDGDHYCPFRLCHDRKGGAWERKELDEQSKKIGISLYKKENGQVAELNPRADADKKLVKSRHADLRLMKAQYTWNNFDGIGPNLRVVAVGKTAEKRMGNQTAERTATVQTAQKAINDAMLRQREEQKRNTKEQFVTRFQWEVVSDISASALNGLTNMDILFFVFDEMVRYQIDADYPEGTDGGDELFQQAKKMRKADGLRMVRRLFMHSILGEKWRQEWRKHYQKSITDEKQPVISYAKSLTGIAEEWGIKLGKNFMSQAEKYQAELNVALKEINKPQPKAEEKK